MPYRFRIFTRSKNKKKQYPRNKYLVNYESVEHNFYHDNDAEQDFETNTYNAYTKNSSQKTKNSSQKPRVIPRSKNTDNQDVEKNGHYKCNFDCDAFQKNFTNKDAFDLHMMYFHDNSQ